MKYIILADSDNVEPFTIPRQLTKINNETLIGRTIRLLKENQIKDIIVTSHDSRFDNLGATRYEPLFNDYKPKQDKGYWVSAFPIELLEEPVCFLLGDVYYSENAIKTIIESKTDSVLFFCTYKNHDKRYIKHHDEPLGFKVVDVAYFKYHIKKMKEYKKSGQALREPIAWELYRSLNGQELTVHTMTKNYIAINDESCDIDKIDDIIKLQIKLGGNNMFKCEALEDFSLKKFKELENIVRYDKEKNEEGMIYRNDTFECSKEIANYLNGENDYKKSFVNIIEVIPTTTTTTINEDVVTTKGIDVKTTYKENSKRTKKSKK